MKKLHLLALVIWVIPLKGLIQAQNVGIGTLTPGFRLDVQGDPNSTLIANINSKVNYVGNNDIRAFRGNAVTNPGFGIGGDFTGGYRGVIGVCSGGNYSGEALYGVFGQSTGTAGTRVGVHGTASGGSSNYGVWGSVSGGAFHYAVFGQNTNLAGYAGYFQGRGLFTNDLRTQDNLYVDDNMGIGTQAPNTKLQILNGSDCSLTSNGFIQFGLSNTWNLILDDNEILARNNGAGNDLFIQNDAGNVLLCASEAGAVGIGITAGQFLANGYLLSVDGKIVAEEMRIQNSNNWPDYVFDSQYDLMSLDELKSSIKLNKHLPNIPSANVVEEEGILIGDMQKRMMEKIEELTLYVIELHERNVKLEQEVSNLREVVGKR